MEKNAWATGPTIPKTTRNIQKKQRNMQKRQKRLTVQTVNYINCFASLHVNEIRSSQIDCNNKYMYQMFVSKACTQAKIYVYRILKKEE